MKFYLLLFLYLLLSPVIWAGEGGIYKIENTTYEYERPKSLGAITTLPKNYRQFLNNSFNKESLPGWGKIALSTGILLVFDQEILKQIQKAGRSLGWGNNDDSKKRIFFGDESLMNAPTNLSSAIFFMGDGWVSLGIAGGFLTSGLLSDDIRAVSTSTQILQGLLITGFTTPILKRISGREEPKTRTSAHGKWRPFPSPNDFANNKTRYDAYPSAHTATFMTTFNIIAENYAEHSYIRPVGYTLMGLLGFQMINQGAHWASDIPLSIAMAHMISKSIVNNSRRIASDSTSSQTATELYFYPRMGPLGRLSAHLEYLF